MTDIQRRISAAKSKENPQESLKILQKSLRKAEVAGDLFLMAVSLLEMIPLFKSLNRRHDEQECFSRVEQVVEAIPAHPRTGALLSRLAGMVREQGKYEKALHLLERALSMFDTPPERAAIFCNMGNCYHEITQYKKALQYYGKAKKEFKDLYHLPQYGICLQNIGNTLREMNQFKKALRTYEEALSIFSRYGLTVQKAHILWNSAIVYDELEQFDKALQCYHEALELMGEDNPVDVARIYNDKGLTLRKLTRYKEALHLLEKAQSLFEKYNMPVELVEARRNIAGIKRNLNQYEEALQDLFSAREELKSLGIPASIKDVEWEIANVYASADQPELAAAFYDIVLNYYRQAHQDVFAAKVMRDKAAVLKDMGEYDQALHLYFQVEDVFKEHEMPAELASTMLNRGNLYRMLNGFQDALHLFEKAQTTYQETGMEVHEAVAKFNKATALYGLCRYEDALAAFKEVEISFSRHGQPISCAETRINAAVVLGELGRYQEAFSMLSNARSGLESSMVLHHVLIDLNEGALLAETGQYIKAQEVLESVLSNAEEEHLLPIAYKASGALAYIHQQNGVLKKAYNYLRKSLHIAERIRGDISPNVLKMSFFSKIEEVYCEMVFLTHALGGFLTAFSYLQKMKARTLKEEVRAAKKSADNPTLPPRISALYSELQRNPVTYESAKELLSEIAQLETDYAEKRARAELAGSRYPGGNARKEQIQSIEAAPPVRKVQKLLHQDEILLDYIFKENSVLMFLLTSQSFVPLLSIVDDNLQKKIYEYFYRIRARSSLLELSQSFYRLLIAPAEKFIQKYRILHIVPYRELCVFPFHALFNTEFVAESHQLVYHPAADFTRKEFPSGTHVLVVGNPGTDLKGVQKECETISSLTTESGRECTLLLREDATKSNFLRFLPECDIIHIACHGIYDSFNPLRSGFTLYDGILQAREMYQLDLKGKLLILGTCRSGSISLKEGNELLGITRAILYAGGTSIASLWETPDTASTLFWKRFYEHVFCGNPVLHAFQHAQKFLISSRFYHPYFWAGYRIIQ
ncbi:MAG: tetratricopeptide repeat protein [Candidatus Methanofastidiosia archaeon]